ncbi:MAG: CapA family protein [Bacteroidota bacterium]
MPVRAPRSGYLLLFSVLILSLAASLLATGLLQEAAAPVQPVGEPPVATLAAVGDTLVHTPEIAAAWDPGTKSHDFRPMFALLKPVLERADLAVAVLETTLGGPESGYTGYPRFNSPDQIADALQWAGVDVVATAHNHMLDRGAKGLFRTIDYLDRIGLAHVGSARSPDPAARFVLKEANGIRFAFLAYTTLTNGLPVPAAQPWSVNLYSQKGMAADVGAARLAGAEIVVCALHTGTEYLRQAEPAQRVLVEQIVKAGVDIVLCSHPHVIRPQELRSWLEPDGTARTAFIAYSLGNLLSNQRQRYSDCGLIVWVTVARRPDGRAQVAAARWQPLWVHKYPANGRSQFRIIPVDATTASAFAGDKSLTAADRRRLAQVWEETLALLGREQELAAKTQPEAAREE